MKAYADTGLLCSLYAPDAQTPAAVARMARVKEPLPLIWLHQLELRNALRLRVFRGEITAVQRDASLNAFLADAAGGIYATANPVLGDVMMEAERLSASHSDTLGTRSLDILHVAAALVLGAAEFWTFDKRQAALAKAAGMKVPG
jgi:predicted nucleic acid-binding protein